MCGILGAGTALKILRDSIKIPLFFAQNPFHPLYDFGGFFSTIPPR
jgi:hypothetical protein